MMDGTVAILGKFLENVPHSSLRTDHCIPWNAESLRQAISCLEANAMDVERQAIGILLDAGNSLVTVGLVNPYRTGRPHAVRVQEDHDLSNDFLGFPGFDDSLFAFGANPIELSQAFRGLLNHVKHLLTKRLDEFFGEVRANAFDHPRAEILFDAF